jgi:3-dehydroquinate synthase
MVDSSVGGKVGVDHARAKNMIGAFHQPSAVLCDVDALASLPDRQYRCGLAEVVKYGVIMAPSFFERIEASVDAINAKDTSMLAELVARSCRCKADVVEEDEFETKGRRAILNYGHTFAHAFEAASGYEELQHGEAVAIGMMCAARLASHLGMVEGSLEDRQRRLWAQLGLPTFVPSHLVGQDLIAIMRRDKKSVAGQLRFVLPTRLGSVETVGGVDERLVERVIEEMADRPGL